MRLPPGADELAAAGSRPADPAAGEEFYLRTWAEPSVDVNGLEGGSPPLQKTVIPVEAQANVSMRLVRPARIRRVHRARLRAAPAPVRARGCRARSRALVVRATRARPAGLPCRSSSGSTRSRRCSARGRCSSAPAASIPLVAALVAPGIATIVTGFGLTESNVHSPNERIPAAYLPLGIETAAALFRRLAELG